MPQRPSRQTTLAYSVAVASVLATVAVRGALDPMVSGVAPLILFLLPVAFSAWYGGLGPGLAATALAAAIGIPLFTGAWRHAAVPHGGLFVWLVGGTPFLLVGAVISFWAARLEAARRRARAMAHAAVESESMMRQAEKQWAEKEQRYGTLFESIDEGFCIVEVLFEGEAGARRPVDYRFLEANPSFERQTGLVGAVGRRMRELAPDHEAHWFETYARVAATGEPVRFEHQAIALNRWYDVFAARVRGAADRHVAILFKDITDRKSAERERERMLAEETGLREAAEQASRLKDEFLAMVSHELRTPLNAIAGWASLLAKSGSDAAILAEGVEVIARNAAAQSQLIEDILDVARIASGKVRLNARPVDARGPVEAAIATVATSARAKDITLTADLGARPAPVDADPDRLQQVFWNLIANAVKFTDRGGEVRLTLTTVDSRLVVTVADSGQGIGADFLPFVFDRFRQADVSTSRQQPGLGLGLSIVRQLVELHGGTVSASSEGRGRGSTFHVELPFATVRHEGGGAGAELDAAAEAECGAALQGARVLVLDDQADASRFVQAMLTRCGAEVTVVTNVSDAIGVLAADPGFGGVVSDIGMAGEDGYAFIRRLRRLEATRGVRRIPVTALTAYTRQGDREAILGSGFNYYLAKPIGPAELLRTVAMMVEKARSG